MENSLCIQNGWIDPDQRMSDPDAYLERLIDEPALVGYLESNLGPVDEYSIERHLAGHSNETLFVTWGPRELVLRRPPPGETADTAHDVLREYRVMDALQETSVRVPHTILACDDTTVIGSEFYVMERDRGHVLRTDEPDVFARPTYRERIGDELVTGLAEIHSIDYESVGLGELGYPDGYIERQVSRWQEQYEWAFEVTTEVRSVPLVETVGEWLVEHTPSSYPHTLVHGDYKLDNVMFGRNVPPALQSVFDWELSTLGDPRFDLGWMLTYWWDAKDPPVPRPDMDHRFMTREGYPTRVELVEQYESRTGIAFDHPRFYRALSVYKIGALCEMFYRRHLEGNADNPKYPKMKKYVPALLERANRIIDDEEPL